MKCQSVASDFQNGSDAICRACGAQFSPRTRLVKSCDGCRKSSTVGVSFQWSRWPAQKGKGPPRIELSDRRLGYPKDLFNAWLASRFERPLSAASKRSQPDDRCRQYPGAQHRPAGVSPWSTNVDLARPLSAAALSVLPGGESKYIFVSPTGARPIADFTHLMERLDHASGVTCWTVHDLRRTARSLIGRADVPVDHAERCLAHTIGGVRGVWPGGGASVACHRRSQHFDSAADSTRRASLVACRSTFAAPSAAACAPSPASATSTAALWLASQLGWHAGWCGGRKGACTCGR
jgi:hypothetical protein